MSSQYDSPQRDALNRFSRMLFYLGTSILLFFLVWIETAQYETTPSFWSPPMARAVMIGAFALFGATAIVSLMLFYDGVQEWREKR